MSGLSRLEPGCSFHGTNELTNLCLGKRKAGETQQATGLGVPMVLRDRPVLVSKQFWNAL